MSENRASCSGDCFGNVRDSSTSTNDRPDDTRRILAAMALSAVCESWETSLAPWSSASFHTDRQHAACQTSARLNRLSEAVQAQDSVSQSTRAMKPNEASGIPPKNSGAGSGLWRTFVGRATTG